MNYIKSLQEKNKAQQEQLNTINQEISYFMEYLASNKFYSPNTMIQADEVFVRMREIRMHTVNN